MQQPQTNNNGMSNRPLQAPSYVSNLNNLLHKSRQLQGQLTNANNKATTIHSTFLQPLRRSLDQVAHRSQALVERSIHGNSLRKPSNLDAASQSFLASVGINSEQLKRDLDALDVSKTLDPVQPLTETDYRTFLNNVHDNTIWSLLEESRVKTEYDAFTLTTQVINTDWQHVKRAFFATTGLSNYSSLSMNSTQPLYPIQTKPNFNESFENKQQQQQQQQQQTSSSYNKNPTSMIINARTSTKSANYLDVVKKLNVSTTRTNVIANMRAACNTTPTTDQYLISLWDMLEQILVPSTTESLSYAQAYLYTSDPKLTFTFLHRARKALELSFFQHVEETVQRHPTAARAGGNPSVISRVSAFTRARHLKSGLRWDIPNVELTATSQSDVPVWAVVYYCVRAGRVKDAVDFLKTNREAVCESDKYMYMYLTLFADNTLHEHEDMVTSLREYYTQLITQKSDALINASNHHFFNPAESRNEFVRTDTALGVDPFKLALVKLLGKCDVVNRKIDHVVSATEDWLWVRLMLVSEHGYMPESLHADVLSMESVLSQQSPFRFAGFLIAAGLFERAVAHLIKASVPSGQASPLFIDTVHIAIALHHYGCLNIPKDPNNVLGMQVDMPSTNQNTQFQTFDSFASTSMSGLFSVTGEKAKTIPFHTLMSKYLRSGAVHDPIDKLHYIARLPLYAVGFHYPDQPSMDLPNTWQASFEQWLMYSYDQLVLWVMTHSQSMDIRIPPRLLDMFKLSSLVDFHRQITVPAANIARAQDLLDRAVYLFAQGDDPSGVFDTLQIILVRAIVYGPGVLVLGNSTGKRTDSSMSVDLVLKQATYVLEQFGVNRPISEFVTESIGIHILESKRNACILLHNILEVKQLATVPNLDSNDAMDVSISKALNRLLELRVIPHDPKFVPACLECIQTLPVVAHGIVPVILKLGMDLIVTFAKHRLSKLKPLTREPNLNGFLAKTAYSNGHGSAELASLQTMAVALRQLAGRVPFNMDASVHAFLAQKVAELAGY